MRAGFWALVIAASIAACNASPAPENGGSKTGAKPSAPPTVDPEAVEALNRMGKTLASAEGIRFIAEAHYDDVLPNGLRLQRNLGLSYTLRRPNGLRVEFEEPHDSRLLVYDGSMATLYDRDRGFYAITSAPDTLDAAIDMLAERADLVIPLSDFLFTNPAKILLANVTAASHVGSAKVGATETDHFVFSQEGLDWQIWIAKGERALPLRIVLTYTKVDGRPQFMATLSDWNLTASTQPTDFKVTIPGTAEQIEFKPDEEGA